MKRYSKNNSPASDVIGLIPAAGRASRLAPLPCSKELYPLGLHTSGDGKATWPKVVSQYLLEKMRLANINKAYIIVRDGKWDIPSYFGDGKLVDMHIGYLMMDLPYGVPFTLNQAYPFVQDSIIALGFPDIMFQPDNAYVQLLAKQEESGADIVLGVFRADNPQKTDMVEFDENGQILSIQIKPEQTELLYTWEIAVWSPVFTKFMHEYVLAGQGSEINKNMRRELFAGDVIHAAIRNHIHVDSVIFEDGNYLDIGTPEDLVRAVQIANRVG